MVTSIVACGPVATFDQPQPAGADNLSKIPNRLQGDYLSDDENSTLHISEKALLRIYDYDFKMHLSELESDQKISGDTLIDITNGDKTIVKVFGDSLIGHVHFVDTLFQLNHENVIRKMKGYFFLNIFHEKSGWEVKKLSLKQGLIEISSLSSVDDIKNLQKITESPSDTVSPYKFAPSNKEFRNFISKGGFKESEKFIRVNK